MPRRVLAVALACTFIATTGACTASTTPPEPTASVATSSGEPTPSPTPTPSASPTRPAAMEINDLEGAKAAARYFLELYPYAYNTGDLTSWKEMSHPDCIFCASVVDNVEQLFAGGGYEVGGELSFEHVTANEPLEGNELYGVDLDVIQGSSTKHDASGSVLSVTETARYRISVALAATGTGWLIRGVSHELADQ
jgi:hypothetical protein